MPEEQSARRFERFPLSSAYYAYKGENGIHGVSDVLDVSLEGFCIFSPSALEKGLKLDFTLTLPKIPDINFQGEVCWSRPAKGGYGVGLRFITIDPEDRAFLLDYAQRKWTGKPSLG